MNHDREHLSPVYQNLNSDIREIRLLKILPTLQDGRINCHLATTRLADAKFVVLSYRWGSADVSHEILLNGQIFYVRLNLWAFLNVIREQPGMLLWIDALCINQDDVSERNAQVRIMGNIFRSASMVLSWLGTPDPYSTIGHAFELMSTVWTPSNTEAQDLSDSLPILRPGQSEADLWKSVAELCNLAYWNRVWVVQEILLSSNNYLLHGQMSLPWQAFANFISLIGVRFQCPPQYAKLIEHSTAKSYTLSKPYTSVPAELTWRVGTALKHDFGESWNTDEYSMFRILTMFGGRDCSDVLDHVYALLSLTDEGFSFPIRYGIGVTDLYLSVIHFCAEAAVGHNQEASRSSVFRPASQRAFLRNAKFLAEVLEVIPRYQRTQPYFYGSGFDNRGPSPRPDPCFPCQDQAMALYCTIIEDGNEPPVLRSNTLRRSLEYLAFDVLLHLSESSSWLLCRASAQTESLTLVAIITIKDSAHGRGFKILDPGRLALSKTLAVVRSTNQTVWEFVVNVEAHLSFFQAVILGIQPE